MQLRNRIAVMAIGAVATLLLALPQAQAKILAQWVQLGPDGTASVRAVVDDACPSVSFDGTAKPMNVRAAPNQSFGGVAPAKFPVTACELAVPSGAISAILDGKPLPLPRPNPQRIVVFGDTGCRLKVGDPWQACNDPQAWPYQKITVLSAAARPDLVIHVGDYEYREDACPVGNAGCANSPAGYGWDALERGFLRARGAALRRRALDHGARQSRGLQPRRRRLVSLPRSHADGKRTAAI